MLMNLFTHAAHIQARMFAALAIVAVTLGMLPMKAGAQAAPTCSVVIVSNTSVPVEETSADAVAVPTPVHSAWTAAFPGATWIWGDDQTATTSGDVTYTFTNQFGFVGTITSATLYVASDNEHSAQMNTGTTHNSADETSFNSPETYDVTGDVAQGSNELSVSVTNRGPQGNIASNPAGALYRLVIEGTPTVDSDCSIGFGEPIPVLGCTDSDAANYNPAATRGNEQAKDCSYEEPVCAIGDNLLVNASFEDPAIGGSWSITSIADWVVTKVSDGTATMGEIWRGLVAPSDGQQNLELDANEPTKITQTVTTVPGATYELSFDFAARSERPDASNNSIVAAVDGTPVVTQSTSNTAWTTYSGTFVADGSSDVSFADMGTPETYGTLIDNATLCLVSMPEPGEETLYRIQGYVWYDANGNALWDGAEDEEEGNEEGVLSGWTVRITNGEDTRTTTTDEEGYYYFDVPAGTWVITEEVQDDWERTTVESYEVTVPAEESVEEVPVEESLVSVLLNSLVPVAHAQVPTPDVYGDYNFGNDEVRRGGGGGTRVGDRDGETPEGEVLGDSDSATPEPLVLGEQVTAVPAGAADTGAGGTSRSLEFFSVVPVASVGRNRKHG